MIGYAFQSYIKEREIIENEKPVEKPEEIPNASNEIVFDSSLAINENNEISGIQNNTVDNIKKLITTNLSVELYDKDNLLTNEQYMGTGDRIIFKDDNGNVVHEYKTIIYGDLNGDGLINSLDVLILQKHILETRLLTGIYLKAGNISKNGNKPNSLDVLKIQKHILETRLIEQ